MAKQRDIATLRDAVRSSSFTPAMRDLDAVIDLLGDADEDVVKASERALGRAGAGGGGVVPRLLARLSGLEARGRVHALRVIGGLAPKDAQAGNAVLSLLTDADTRVARAAANALGRLEGSEARTEIAAALLAAWDETPELPLARAIAEALGKLGVVEARDRLDSVREGDAELARVAGKAVAMLRRDGSRGDASEIKGDQASDFEVDLVLFCREGLESLLREELAQRDPTARVGQGDAGLVRAVWRGAPEDLWSIRTMLGFGFALPPEPFAKESDIEAACVRALGSETARRILETWTSGTVRYRIDWEGKGHKRAATWSLVDALASRYPTWVNDPTESTWELAVTASAGQVRVLLCPRKLADPRFVYRLRDVPASSHPTLAAALVRASRPRADDVVWDPFAGSGSELVERARAGSYTRLIGSDADPAALEAARENVAAASVEGVLLEQADATSHAPAGVNSIITNPPMGRRVARDGSLATLLDAFTDNAARVLVSGGRVTWLSPLGGRTAARAEANGLRVSLRRSVDMGGFHAELQVWDKP